MPNNATYEQYALQKSFNPIVKQALHAVLVISLNVDYIYNSNVFNHPSILPSHFTC